MTSTSVSLERLIVEADKAAAGAAAAKELVHSAKAELKKTRKLAKAAKKAAKLARKKVEAAKAAGSPALPRRPAKSPKSKSAGARRAAAPRSRPPAKGLQSASQVAKAVITRMSVSGRAEHAAMGTSAEVRPVVMAPEPEASARSEVVHA